MLSLTPPKPTLPHRHHSLHRHGRHRRLVHLPSITAIKIPSSTPPVPPNEVYQPFRPPPSPIPAKYLSLNPAQRLDVLRDRLGVWHDYAPLISALSRDGFTPSSIEEVTGITGVDQNRLVVAAQVRSSLLASASSLFDPDLLPFFDPLSGADLLYELRLLNASQRALTAARIVRLNLDGQAAQELARAVKDFPRRRGDEGWEHFAADAPGDCLAYSHFRFSREITPETDRLSALEKAISAAESEGARKRIERERERVLKGGKGEEEEEEVESVRVPVVRLRYGEVAEAASVAVLPVCKAREGEEGVRGAPERLRWGEGRMGVVEAEKGWRMWVVLPGWAPVLGLMGGEGGGVAVEFADGRVLPWWRVNKWEEEAAVVVVDRKRREVVERNGFYLVVGGNGDHNGELGVERGKKLVESGVKEALGTVVLVVRPPKEEDD